MVISQQVSVALAQPFSLYSMRQAIEEGFILDDAAELHHLCHQGRFCEFVPEWRPRCCEVGGNEESVIYEYIDAIRKTMEEVKPGLELTAAFMPEGANDPKFADVYYAQNYALHSTVLDMISRWLISKRMGKRPVGCRLLHKVQNNVSIPPVKFTRACRDMMASRLRK